MSFDKVKKYFESVGMGDKVLELAQSSATVEEAALAVGTEAKQIAKTLSFLQGEKAVLIVTAGDARIDNKKYKELFREKAKMIPWDLVESCVGHVPGGVCPFEIKPDVTVYLDVSMKRFDIVYPAAGSDHSAVKMTLDELETHSKSIGWIDVCKDWQDN